MTIPSTFSYRLAAVDLDDTLLGPDKIISAANADAIRRLRDAGVTVTLASGRRHENMIRFHRQLGLQGIIVSCNGAQVRDAETDEVFHQRLLPSEHASRVIEEGYARGLTQNYYHTDGAVYVREKTKWSDLYERRTGSEVVAVGDLRQFQGESVLKIIWIDAPERLGALRDHAQSEYPDLYVTTTDPEYLEFMEASVSKAAGVAVAAARLGVSQSEILAFGDGNNDLPMLRWAGCGIAMADASDTVKQAADRVAPPGNPETSFARAVDLLLPQREAISVQR
ncbi:MAG: Cof-type HAD-IIB family hydrolase [Armatimonadota bacterium]